MDIVLHVFDPDRTFDPHGCTVMEGAVSLILHVSHGSDDLNADVWEVGRSRGMDTAARFLYSGPCHCGERPRTLGSLAAGDTLRVTR